MRTKRTADAALPGALGRAGGRHKQIVTDAEASVLAPVETLMCEQQRTRLVSGLRALTRFHEIIGMVACAYDLEVGWLPEDTSVAEADGEDAAVAAEARMIAERLAGAGQLPLVIGDPVRRTLWLARRPFALVLHRVHSVQMTLETVAPSAGLALDSAASSPTTAQLMRQCGPAACALVAQSDTLLRLAPRIASLANCAPLLRHMRYVLAAPHDYARTRGALLTSWSERLLCLPVGAREDREAMEDFNGQNREERSYLAALAVGMRRYQ